MAPDGGIDPYEAHYAGQRLRWGSLLSFAILEFLNQFPLLLPFDPDQ